MSVNRIVLMISSLNHTLNVNPVLHFPLAVSVTVIRASLESRKEFRIRPRGLGFGPGQLRRGMWADNVAAIVPRAVAADGCCCGVGLSR